MFSGFQSNAFQGTGFQIVRQAGSAIITIVGGGGDKSEKKRRRDRLAYLRYKKKLRQIEELKNRQLAAIKIVKLEKEIRLDDIFPIEYEVQQFLESTALAERISYVKIQLEVIEQWNVQQEALAKHQKMLQEIEEEDEEEMFFLMSMI